MAKQQECGSDDDETSYPEFYYRKNKVPTYKVILLGETGSGKTSLFLRYKYGSFRKGATLNGADRFLKEFISEDGDKVQMFLWDTAGMERMGSLTFHYYHGAHAVMFVYALNDKASFDSLSQWNDDVSRYSPQGVKRFLVATKNDIPKDEVEVSIEKIYSFCKNKNIIDSYSTSAKTGDGIDEMFNRVIKILRESVNVQKNDEDVWAVSFPKRPRKKQPKCGC